MPVNAALFSLFQQGELSMHQPRPYLRELWSVAIIAVLGALLFAIWHRSTEFLLLFFLAYALWHSWQVAVLVHWLINTDRQMPEHAHGLWREVYHLLYLRERKSKRRQRQLLNVIKEFRDSTNALPDSAVSLGVNGEIIWFNRAAVGMLGLRPHKDLGQRISNLLRHPQFTAFEIAARGVSSVNNSIEIPSPLDANMMLSLRMTSYRSGQRLLMVRDVTRLQKLEQMRQDFVANVSHELRTPVTVLMGYLETMHDAGEEKLGRYAKPLRQMQQQALRMRALVDDLLLLSRLDNERSSLPFERVDVPHLLQTLVDDARMLSGGQRHLVSADIDPSLGLQAAAKELHSALWNLVGNAVRYTPAGGTIAMRWARNDKGQAVFSVTDSGPGIEAQHLPRLTERFYRVDAGRSRDAGGTGLGLAIVKHVLERHGGSLNIASVVGQGSTFSCVFPASALYTLAASGHIGRS